MQLSRGHAKRASRLHDGMESTIANGSFALTSVAFATDSEVKPMALKSKSDDGKDIRKHKQTTRALEALASLARTY